MEAELSYQELSSSVYKIDPKDKNFSPLKKGDKTNAGGTNYQVLKTENNTDNGMQAMAVAPVKDGTDDEADTSEVVIAYAGTNFDDEVDIHTDLQTVIGES